jgi:hypothetical protein
MKFYNTEAAKILVEKKLGLLRVQEKKENYESFGIPCLENKSAEYSLSLYKKTHYGLGDIHYCHATSPIRRYADILNQTILKGDLISYNIDLINHSCKQNKKYERDMLFIEKLLNSESRQVEGIVVSNTRVWVYEWNRFVSCYTDENIGKKGILHYYLNMNESTWKRRMCFRFEDTNCREQQNF